jgi:hypothetical protein
MLDWVLLLKGRSASRGRRRKKKRRLRDDDDIARLRITVTGMAVKRWEENQSRYRETRDQSREKEQPPGQRNHASSKHSKATGTLASRRQERVFGQQEEE